MSNPYETAKQKKTSILGPTLRFKGELSAEEDLLIQGRVEGSIKHSSNLTVGEEGHVKANIAAEYIAVEGKVDGDMSGSKSVVIRDTADIDGNIYSPVVTLLEGARFNGSIDMSGRTAADVVDSTADAESSDAVPVREKVSETKSSDDGRSSDQNSSPSSAKKKSQRPEKKSASAA